jgi:dymeclin
MVRSDLDTVLLPLLHMLYASDRRNASQLYMLLIIVLLLSQDPAFAANVHK